MIKNDDKLSFNKWIRLKRKIILYKPGLLCEEGNGQIREWANELSELYFENIERRGK